MPTYITKEKSGSLLTNAKALYPRRKVEYPIPLTALWDYSVESPPKTILSVDSITLILFRGLGWKELTLLMAFSSQRPVLVQERLKAWILLKRNPLCLCSYPKKGVLQENRIEYGATISLMWARKASPSWDQILPGTLRTGDQIPPGTILLDIYHWLYLIYRSTSWLQ